MNRHTRAIAAGLAATAVLALAGCSVDKTTEPLKDAPRSGTNNGAAEVITMPDGFNNVAAKCDGPNRVYVIFHGDSKYGALAVVPNDPRCVKH